MKIDKIGGKLKPWFNRKYEQFHIQWCRL